MTRNSRRLASLLIDVLLEDEHVQETICEDCPLNKSREGCPLDYDYYDVDCWNRNFVELLELGLISKLEEFGL